MDDQSRIRGLTLFFTSIFCVLLMFALALRGYAVGAWPVVLGNGFGMLLALTSAIVVRRNPENLWATYAIAVFLAVFIVTLVMSGYQNSVTVIWLLAVPPVAILVLGTRPGLWVSLAFAPFFSWVLIGSDLIEPAAMAADFRYRLPVVYLLIMCVTGVYAWSTDYFYEKMLRANQRIDALERILPMCAECKRVRIEEEWSSVEQYISDETNQMISHGICPECDDRLYGHIQR